MFIKVWKNPYHLLVAFILLRMGWLVTFEPRGAARSIALHPDTSTLVGVAASTLPYVVYSSILLLVIILIGVLLKKYWSYIAVLVLASIQWILTVSLVLIGGNPGFGPIYVISACTGLILFSILTIKNKSIEVNYARTKSQ